MTQQAQPTGNPGEKIFQELNKHLEKLNRNLEEIIRKNQQQSAFPQGQQGQQSQPGAPGAPGSSPPVSPAASVGGAGGRAGAMGMLGRVGGMAAGPWGIAASILLPLLFMGAGAGQSQRNVEKLNSSIDLLGESAIGSADSIAQAVINIRRAAIEAGTAPSAMFGLAPAFSRIGVDDPMGDAATAARRPSDIARGLVTGLPDTGAMMGALHFGLDPMSIVNMDPTQFQRRIVESLRGMTPDQRMAPYTRERLSQLMGDEGQAVSAMMMANLPERDWQRAQRQQDRSQEFMNNRMAQMMESRGQNLLAIQTGLQLKQMETELAKEFLKRGDTQPYTARIKADLSEQFMQAQERFWVQMIPAMEQFGEIMSHLGRPGGAIEEFGDVLDQGAISLANVIRGLVGTLVIAGGVIQAAFMPAHVVSDLYRGDFESAWQSFADPGRTMQAGWLMAMQDPTETRRYQNYISRWDDSTRQSVDVNIGFKQDAGGLLTAGVQSAGRQGRQVSLTPRTPAVRSRVAP